MPPVRTNSPVGASKTERTREENQERAYIAASRRRDRSISARLESAQKASEIHKLRTGRGLRITEASIINDEMYEEEDDDFARRCQTLFARYYAIGPQYDHNLANYMAQQAALQNPVQASAPATVYQNVYFAQPSLIQPSVTQPSVTQSTLNSHHPPDSFQIPVSSMSETLGQNVSLDPLQHIPSNLQDIPDLQQMPNMPNVQQMSNMPNVQRTFSMPNVQQMAMSNVQQMSSMPSIQQTSSMPSVQHMSSVQDIFNDQDILNTQGMLNTQSVLTMQSIPNIIPTDIQNDALFDSQLASQLLPELQYHTSFELQDDTSNTPTTENEQAISPVIDESDIFSFDASNYSFWV